MNFTEGPHHQYSNILNNPCIPIENQLFEIEAKLRKLVEDDDMDNPGF